MIQPFRGTYDQLPDIAALYYLITSQARTLSQHYGYQEMATPIFEYASLFSRTLGETSDIIHKEMFTFLDRHQDLLALRPEGTAGVMRAIHTHKLYNTLPLKFFSVGPMFRYERPQKGRTRQFHQFGMERVGDAYPASDVEVIALAWDFLNSLNLQGELTLEINTLGDKESYAAYREALIIYFTNYRDSLSSDSQNRLLKNPLRILDSKNIGDQEIVAEAPSMATFLSPAAKQFFDNVCEGLNQLNIPFIYNPLIVRGLDYYSHTAFEFKSTALGSQNAILAGGRYDGLSEQMGGPFLPAVGWASSLERLAIATTLKPECPRPLFLIPLGEQAVQKALKWAHILRKSQFIVDWEGGESLKTRLKKANQKNAQYVVIFGSDELETNKIQLKNLDTGHQEFIQLDHESEESHSLHSLITYLKRP